MEVPRATKTVKTTRTTVALKVRSGAGTGYRALKVFPKGTAVSVGGASGAWSKVTALKTTGWVKTKYLSTTTATVTIPNYRYTKTTVPVHKAVGGRGGTLVVLDARTKVELLAVSGDWAKVKTGKNVGWVKLSVLQASLPAAVVRYTEAAVGIRSAAGSNTVVADDVFASVNETGAFDAEATFDVGAAQMERLARVGSETVRVLAERDAAARES